MRGEMKSCVNTLSTGSPPFTSGNLIVRENNRIIPMDRMVKKKELGEKCAEGDARICIIFCEAHHQCSTF